MDGDGQDDAAEIPRLLDRAWNSGEGVAAGRRIRTTRRDRWSRRLATKFANRLRQKLLHDNCPDTSPRRVPASAFLRGHAPVSAGAVPDLRPPADPVFRSITGSGSPGNRNTRISAGPSLAWRMPSASSGCGGARDCPGALSRNEPGGNEAGAGLGRASFRICLLVLLSAALFVPGQSPPPFDRDEVRATCRPRRRCSRPGILSISGFRTSRAYLQPAGIYWLQAASVALFSEPGAREAWAHRLPSLLGATAAVLLPAWLGNCGIVGFGSCWRRRSCSGSRRGWPRSTRCCSPSP